jgi:hypothetical protein
VFETGRQYIFSEGRSYFSQTIRVLSRPAADRKKYMDSTNKHSTSSRAQQSCPKGTGGVDIDRQGWRRKNRIQEKIVPEYKQALAYPLLGYHILKNPEQSNIVAIAFDTEAGPSVFAATREILEELAEAFRRHASQMPRKEDQN